uniref:G_PROTEIN_RECEP_F1_2 domain-containing protein n=1 Tax=Steinernema glaseri TaxID=37863 RepID=A0A1I8AM47_9BILA
MRAYRWYLLAISLCNLAITINFALLWAPQTTLRGLKLCFPSSYLSNDFIPVLLVILNTCLFGQWQLLQITLISPKFIPFTTVFTILPSCLLTPAEFPILTKENCFDASVRPTSILFLFSIMTYQLLFTAGSAYLLLKISRASRNHSSATSIQTVKLVRTVKRNFLSLVLLVAVVDVIPLIVTVISFLLPGDKGIHNLQVTMMSCSAVCISFYSSMTTVTTIVVTTPYRRKTLQIFASVVHYLIIKAEGSTYGRYTVLISYLCEPVDDKKCLFAISNHYATSYPSTH